MQSQIQRPILRVTLSWVAFTKYLILPQFDNSGKERNIREILDLNEQGKLEAFELFPIEEAYKGKVHLGLSLKTGNFLMNGMPVSLLPETLQDKNLQFRLIFFRRNRVETTNNIIQQQYVHRYLLGWQVTYKGENYQRILFFDPLTLLSEFKEKR